MEVFMKPILLNDLLNFSNEQINNTKIRLLTVPSADRTNDPHRFYIENPEQVSTGWFLWKQSRQGRPFTKGQVGIGLLNLGNDRWLLITIKNILEELPNTDSGVHYTAEEIPEYSPYFGRVVIKYHNTIQQLVRHAKEIINDLEVLEILSTQYDGTDFPGYDNICLSFKNLETIIQRQKKDWITALKNQKGIYLLTDTKTGKLYVGSATSDKGMILQRWTNYIENGTGGNVNLIELKEKEGFDYIKKYFQFSVLENYNRNTPDDYILDRESWWKNVLQSRVFGYNGN
jgi:hypothetical protein